ncbi:lipoprotein LpqH [Mycobacterium xenopi]|uniref:Lipoprotein LppE n=1 Tax=Mycobacterium xenopi TaxID=1789 RepID=A0AAD1H1N8_MYCXE|nr:lipoprotein LpqH [Mycobacterium xenopi]MDA3640212.1 lipoprotein LpqH [Mycobacterium xenopi]MDA3658475.1 lipoprotein LpqH [Mycobacterium xenopi]MDA3662500.1 lipoprotein LpqH [Mycobacterium xenopi]ORX19463.1 hypothetical protein AWC32_10230 [Mycobacterium xenopi]SPX92705.1 conserved lipoprotein LppE [Mycobacterium xenopi]
MRCRAFAMSALVALAAVCGCSQAQIVPRKAARVTVGGRTYTSRAPRCSQLQSFWTIEAAGPRGHVEAVVLLHGDQVIPQWVKISGFDGFTGSFWRGGVGDAVAHLARNNLTITGSADGIDSARPNKVTTTDFTVTVDC